MAAKLVPLNIPGGWVVLRNTFADEDPILQNGWIVNVQSYGEDLLLIQALSPQANDLTIDPQGIKSV
ncbi:MAG: hypothetical protein HC825_09975 [Oscillatoriales cyanobacterium RM1_1_9]|nr:hypothetical protein [Oscillatoriales cyanobacterium RM1_1_9]